MYLPVDLRRKAGKGYAFINFVSNEQALRFKGHFQGWSAWHKNSQKQAETTWGQNQGLQHHIDTYRNSPFMHPEADDAFKAAVFRGGHRVDFPAPTKRVRAPRPERDKGAAAESASVAGSEALAAAARWASPPTVSVLASPVGAGKKKAAVEIAPEVHDASRLLLYRDDEEDDEEGERRLRESADCGCSPRCCESRASRRSSAVSSSDVHTAASLARPRAPRSLTTSSPAQARCRACEAACRSRPSSICSMALAKASSSSSTRAAWAVANASRICSMSEASMATCSTRRACIAMAAPAMYGPSTVSSGASDASADARLPRWASDAGGGSWGAEVSAAAAGASGVAPSKNSSARSTSSADRPTTG
mmetsp:Transcript_90724/g.290832  ORF Transcript_90724/g.290832 Transcript_90724/m.290832 type:complete len:364 (-) Transcript_90724:843-1934(-)